jgi:hypothetical protein
LGNLGVGRVSPTTNGVGGLIFSAQSDSFNLLIRALKAQGRVDVLSRPQVMTLDNQTAAVNIGQDFPIIGNTTLVGGGLAQTDVVRRNVGVLLRVTPRITPDGKVLMRVFPEVSSVGQTVVLSPTTISQAFNIQQVETTVVAQDGETVVIGGLIQQRDTKTENKVPCLGDLPYIGAAFRYRTQVRQKTELLVVLTPHIVRSQADADRIACEEARRMSWIVDDVRKIHASSGLPAPSLPEVPTPMILPSQPGMPMDGSIIPGMPTAPGPITLPPPAAQPVTPPPPAAQPVTPPPSGAPIIMPPVNVPVPPSDPPIIPTHLPASHQVPTQPTPGKEPVGWNKLPRN